MTNADRIRAMTDEELADFLGRVVHDWGGGDTCLRGRGTTTYIDNWLDWLKEEVAE